MTALMPGGWFDGVVATDEVVMPVKNEDREQPVPEVWRPALSAIVESLIRDDRVLVADLAVVRPMSGDLSQACRDAVQGYGDVTLVSLPQDTWETSVCRWQGDRWQCLVDLWTAQEGRSDLVLDVDVFEDGAGYRYSVNLVYVP